MGAANKGAAKRQTVSRRIVHRRSIYVRSVFIVENVIIGNISQTLHLDDQRRGRSSHAERRRRRMDTRVGQAAAQRLSASFDFS